MARSGVVRQPSPCSDSLRVSVRHDGAVGTRTSAPANPPEQLVLLRLCALGFGLSRARSRHTCPGPCEARRSSLLSCSGQGCTHGNDRCGPPTIAVLGLDACFGSPRRRSGHTRVSPMRTRRSSLSCSDCGRCVLVRHDVALGTHALAPAKPAGAVYCPALDKGERMATACAVNRA